METKIDLGKCEGTIYIENVRYIVTLSDYKVTVYGNGPEENILSEEIIPYDYQEVADGSMLSIIYWLARGIHGIPLEFRNVIQKKNE